jgi:hypothetical protein
MFWFQVVWVSSGVDLNLAIHRSKRQLQTYTGLLRWNRAFTIYSLMKWAEFRRQINLDFCY